MGGGYPALQTLTDAERTGWRYTTALKIDVLLRHGEQITVCEVKPAASVSAIGAAVCYVLALRRDEPRLDLAGGGIITEHLPPDIEWLAGELGIQTWEV